MTSLLEQKEKVRDIKKKVTRTHSKEEGMKIIETIIKEFETGLGKKPFVLTDHYTIVDILATCFLARVEMIKKMDNVPAKDHFGPNVTKYFNEMKKRPSYKEANIIDTFEDTEMSKSFEIFKFNLMKVILFILSLIIGRVYYLFVY